MSIQKNLGEALSNFVAVSSILTEDFLEFEEAEDGSNSWRRNYIRTVTATIEGYSHCFRNIALICLESDSWGLFEREIDALSTGFGYTTADRIELTLKATYKLFDFNQNPEFGSSEWGNAKRAIELCHSLMYPKSVEDLEISDVEWPRLRDGCRWLFNHHFEFVRFIIEIRLKQIG